MKYPEGNYEKQVSVPDIPSSLRPPPPSGRMPFVLPQKTYILDRNSH
ncbi:MAG: hypothetical protein OXG10_02200 [Candidatus Dadabacteria bacterium]|nr:hypothetical protein [Candidatus Dadabacteria bacterium]